MGQSINAVHQPSRFLLAATHSKHGTVVASVFVCLVLITMFMKKKKIFELQTLFKKLNPMNSQNDGFILRTNFLLATSAALILATIGLLRSITTPAPIYASDEYGYLKQAQMVGESPSVAARDPYLQAINNRLYFKILDVARALSSDVTAVVRALNLIGYYGLLGVGGFLWLLRRGCKLGAGIFAFLLCAQAFSVFVLSLMPEITYAVIFTVGGWVLVTQIGARPTLAIVLSALIFVLLLYIKPHAVAVVLAFLVFVPAEAFLRRDLPSHLIGKSVLAVGVVMFFVAAINLWLFQDLSLRPHFIGVAYSKCTSWGLKFWMSTDHIGQAVRIASAHSLGIIILFPTLLLLRIRGEKGIFMRGNRSAVLQPLALFLSLCLIAVISMVIKFSVEVGALDAGEYGRLHGRYVAPLFPLMAWLVAEWSESQSTKVSRHWGLFIYVAAVVGFVLCLKEIRLFPWDYADLFLFFKGQNSYWPFPQLEWVRPAVLCIGVFLLGLCVNKKISVQAVLLALGMVASIGSLMRVTFWQENHARFQKKLSDAGRALRLAHPKLDDRLMILGTERYGSMSYVLYGYDGFPWVRQISAGETLCDIPLSVALVAGIGSVELPFELPIVQRFGALTLFGRDRAAIGGFVAPAPFLKSGESMITSFRAPLPDAMVWGFNEAEPWGAWTSKPVARVILNRKILGRVCIKGVAWVAARTAPSFTLKLGKTSVQVPATATPQPFLVECDVDVPAEEAQVLYPIYLKQPGSRPLGVALTQLEFTLR